MSKSLKYPAHLYTYSLGTCYMIDVNGVIYGRGFVPYWISMTSGGAGDWIRPVTWVLHVSVINPGHQDLVNPPADQYPVCIATHGSKEN